MLMRILSLCLLMLAALSVWVHTIPSKANPPHIETPPDASQAFALIELFTSEGCSSCPPADRLLSQVAADAEELGLPIYTLSFHVDYWNYLGWRDPYSDATYSQRQRAYNHTLREGVYTPQMVVNGRFGVVGSDQAALETHLATVFSETPTSTLSLSVAPHDDATLAASWIVSGVMEGSVLHLALVERELTQQVTRGENRGRRLVHDNVVRHFQTVSPTEDASLLPIPDDLVRERASVIAYVQRGANGPIYAAAKVDLANATMP